MKKPRTRQEARVAIVQAANRHMLRNRHRRWVTMPVRLLNQRQIQLAVFVCRQNLLVDAELLDLAGYRPVRAR